MHTQKGGIDITDWVIDSFPFRIHTVRTDRGHELQAHFPWHVEDKGIRNVQFKPRSPQLNGQVGRSHRSDQKEFHQPLTYIGDADPNQNLPEWERFYDFDRPHAGFDGRTPNEELRSRVK